MKVAETAKILGVSKKTIYRKIDSLNLVSMGYVTNDDNGKTIDDKGFELIKSDIESKRQRDTSSNNVPHENFKTNDEHAIESYKYLLQNQKELYETLLNDKNKLIESLSKDKDRLMTIHENSQILLAREQEKNLLLEDPKKEKKTLFGWLNKKEDQN